MKYNVREGDYRTMGAVVRSDGVVLPLRGEKSRNAVLYCMKRKQGKLEKYRFRILTMWVHCAQLW